MHQRTSQRRLDSPPGASRRSLLKAGANAAWITPTVVLVTSAPAAATCSGPPNVGVTVSADNPNGTQDHLVTVIIDNTGSAKPATSTVRITMNGTGNFDPAGTTPATGSWTSFGIGPNTVDYTTTDAIPCGTSSFTVTIRNSIAGPRTFSVALLG